MDINQSKNQSKKTKQKSGSQVRPKGPGSSSTSTPPSTKSVVNEAHSLNTQHEKFTLLAFHPGHTHSTATLTSLMFIRNNFIFFIGEPSAYLMFYDKKSNLTQICNLQFCYRAYKITAFFHNGKINLYILIVLSIVSIFCLGRLQSNPSIYILNTI